MGANSQSDVFMPCVMCLSPITCEDIGCVRSDPSSAPQSPNHSDARFFANENVNHPNKVIANLSRAYMELHARRSETAPQVQKERDLFVLDARRLDWLDQQGDPGIGWTARKSTTGRGYRLHQEARGREHGYQMGNSPRSAIDKAMGVEPAESASTARPSTAPNEIDARIEWLKDWGEATRGERSAFIDGFRAALSHTAPKKD